MINKHPFNDIPSSIEKLKKDEGSRMRSENKELEYSLEKLRQQRIEVENKLELMVCRIFSIHLAIIDGTTIVV